MHIISDDEKKNWIKDHVQRETAGASKWVEDTEAAIKQVQEDTRTADIAGLMTRESDKMFQEIIVTIRDCLSDLARSDDGEDGEAEDDERTEQGKLCEDDEPCWVIGTISKMVSQRMERFC